MTRDIQIRKCKTLEEFHGCVELQRQIWGEADLEVEPVTMFVVAAHTGGQVLGAFDGGRMIGYTLAVVGLHDGVPYLHSHMTGVLSGYRGRGVGRRLKLFQRDEARHVEICRRMAAALAEGGRERFAERLDRANVSMMGFHDV